MSDSAVVAIERTFERAAREGFTIGGKPLGPRPSEPFEITPRRLGLQVNRVGEPRPTRAIGFEAKLVHYAYAWFVRQFARGFTARPLLLPNGGEAAHKDDKNEVALEVPDGRRPIVGRRYDSLEEAQQATEQEARRYL